MIQVHPLLSRIPAEFSPRNGLLLTEHFQSAWATNDIDRAKELFSKRLGVRNFTQLSGPLADGGEIRVELAWVGTIMYELITASGPGSDIYTGRLPTDQGFAMKHHHLGFIVDGQDNWDGLEDEAERAGWAIPHKSVNAGFMTSCFIDAPELGHYLEYIMPEPAGLDFFRNVARN